MIVLNIFMQSLICFLVVYAVIQIGIGIYNRLLNFSTEEKDEVYIIITVKNLQDKIEGIIRSIVWKNLNNRKGGKIPNILVVDLGSDDETPEILHRLCQEYDFIKCTDKKNYAKFIQDIIK